MPAKKKSSITTKLTGFAIVAAIVVFSAKRQLPIAERNQGAQVPIAAVPVDRSLMSQRLLPSLPDLDFIAAAGNTSCVNTSSEVRTGDESNQVGSQTGPSLYELRLDDQKAWSSQPRRASLASTKRQPADSSEKIGVVRSQSPIVPGCDDPHLWYESQHMELASLEVQQMDQIIANDPTEFTELPSLSSEDTFSETSQPGLIAEIAAPAIPPEVMPFPASPLSAKPFPVKEALQKAIPTPAAQMNRAWETGRY